MTKLSILICTIPQRKAMFDALCEKICSQANEEVELLFDDHAGLVGQKRQRLLESAKGDYVCYIDDDDDVSDKYVESILNAISSNPDCVGIKGIMTTNGKLEQQWEISKDIKHWNEKDGMFYRHTNHLAPVRREIALQVGFTPKNHGEDYDYSMGLKGKLRSEVKIEHGIYHYKYIPKK